MKNLLRKISDRSAKVGLIGLGYVGLPLAVEFGKHFDTVGFDVKQSRLDSLRRGEDPTLETSPAELASGVKLMNINPEKNESVAGIAKVREKNNESDDVDFSEDVEPSEATAGTSSDEDYRNMQRLLEAAIEDEEFDEDGDEDFEENEDEEDKDE